MTLTQNYKFAKFGPKTEMCSSFYEIWHLKQIKHASYEYSTWNWWSWQKIIDSGKFGSNTEIYSDFYEIWHSEQIKHAYYKYNTSQYLERLHNYRLRTWNYNTNYSSYYSYMPRMIISCKIRLTVRTWLIALTSH